MTHLINPLADKRMLRQPPVLLEHGGTIDPTAYLVASSIQHFPEKWPRTAQDGPMKSWNRSLAFMLANNGFDVWLAETRGSNDRNRRHIKTKALKTALKGGNAGKNMTVGEQINEIISEWDYWGFSQDDIIAHELKSHMDTVLRLTGSKKLHLMTFSLSTPTSLAFLSIRPDYASKVQGYISMAPIISGEGVSKFVKVVFQTVCPLLPNSIGTLVLTDIILTQPFRDAITLLSVNKRIRYSSVKSVITSFMGSSPKWRTLLDLNVIGHLFRSLSFKELKQMCQQTRANKLQKFDYGPLKNKLIYNQTDPPVYDISNLKIKDWIVVSAANDLLSTPQVYEHLYKIVNPKPMAHIVAQGFNHLDLIVGWENDKYVNMPIVRYLEGMSYTPGAKDDDQSIGARSFDLRKFFPPELNSLTDGDSSSSDGSGATKSNNPFDLGNLFEQISKNVQTLINSLGGDMGSSLLGGTGSNGSKRDAIKGGGGSNNSSSNGNKSPIEGLPLPKLDELMDIANPVKLFQNLGAFEDLLKPKSGNDNGKQGSRYT